MSNLPACTRCASTQTYEDGSGLVICPDCGHEWSPTASASTDDASDDGALVVRDSVGNVLSDGDAVVLIKDVKVKGSPTGLKAGTKVKKIRLVDGDHNLDCHVEGIGQIGLKSELVRRA